MSQSTISKLLNSNLIGYYIAHAVIKSTACMGIMKFKYNTKIPGSQFIKMLLSLKLQSKLKCPLHVGPAWFTGIVFAQHTRDIQFESWPCQR